MVGTIMNTAKSTSAGSRQASTKRVLPRRRAGARVPRRELPPGGAGLAARFVEPGGGVGVEMVVTVPVLGVLEGVEGERGEGLTGLPNRRGTSGGPDRPGR